MLDAAGDKPVTFRTLDIGGDKVLPYMKRLDEENPALGWRAIRIGLDRPGSAAHCSCARCSRAGAGRELRVMFPMVSTVEEFRRGARDARPRDSPSCAGTATSRRATLKLGAMVEVPSLLWELDEIAERADFLSVGSNDLMQYLYAADRDNKRVSGRFDDRCRRASCAR